MQSFFPRGVLDEILNLIESVSEDFPSYSFKSFHKPYVLAFFYIYLAEKRSLSTEGLRLNNDGYSGVPNTIYTPSFKAISSLFQRRTF